MYIYRYVVVAWIFARRRKAVRKKDLLRRKENGVHLSSGDRIKIARESIIGVKSKEISEEYEFPPEEKEEEEKNERNVAAS